MQQWTVEKNQQGMRLDKVVGEYFPTFSLRARRRLIERGYVLLNGKKALSGKHVFQGDAITFRESEEKTIPQASLIVRHGDFFLFAKPAFLHTVSLQGSMDSSLERQIRTRFIPSGEFFLLQRLDYFTSGLVLCARVQKAQREFRREEKEGCVLKKYLALLEGDVPHTLCQKALATDNCTKTRVLPSEDPPLRQTVFTPLAFFSEGDILPPWLSLPFSSFPCALTLVGCEIMMGRRHQIRAHAGFLHHPLFGDTLYGGRPHDRFYLHHGALFFLPKTKVLYPSWMCQELVPHNIKAWMHKDTRLSDHFS